MDSEQDLQVLRESMLKSLGTLASDPADDFTEAERRWAATFREHADNESLAEDFGI